MLGIISQFAIAFLGLFCAGCLMDFFYRGGEARGFFSCLVSAVIAYALFIFAFFLLDWILPGNRLVQAMASLIVYGSILWVSYQMDEFMELVVMGVTLFLWMYVQNLLLVASTLSLFSR